MIIRRLSDSIRRQDWFTVMVEVVIVVVGVYVGIFIGDAAKEREVQREVISTLKVLKTQLESDLENVDNIIELRLKKLEQNKRAFNLLSAEEIDKDALGEVLNEIHKNSFTFFPNTSAYQSLRDQGFLPKIKEGKVRDSITNIYDRMYVRHTVLADESDADANFFKHNALIVFWDISSNEFIGNPEIAKARLKNGVSGMDSNSTNYIIALRDRVYPSIVQTIEGLDVYLKTQEGSIE